MPDKSRYGTSGVLVRHSSSNRIGGIVFGEIVLGFVVVIVANVDEEILRQDVLLGVTRSADRLGVEDNWKERASPCRACTCLPSLLLC